MMSPETAITYAITRVAVTDDLLEMLAAGHAAWKAKQEWEAANVSPYLRQPHRTYEDVYGGVV